VGSWTSRYLLYMATVGEMGYAEKVSGNFAKIEEVLGTNEDALDAHKASHDTVDGILKASSAHITKITGAVYPTTIGTVNGEEHVVLNLLTTSGSQLVPINWAYRGTMRKATGGNHAITLYGMDLDTGIWGNTTLQSGNVASINCHHYWVYASVGGGSGSSSAAFYMIAPTTQLTSMISI